MSLDQIKPKRYHYHHDGLPNPLECPGCNEEQGERLADEFAKAARDLHAVEFKDFESSEYQMAVNRYTLAEYNLNRWGERNGKRTLEEV